MNMPISQFHVVDRLRAGVDRYLADWTKEGRPIFVVEAKDAQPLDLNTALAHVQRLIEMRVSAAIVPVASPQPSVASEQSEATIQTTEP